MNSLTEFQKRVYKIAKKIPREKVLTYKQVAVRLGNAKLARAVGNALNKNKDPKVPCHRVVRSNGKVGGYAYGIRKKILILKEEGAMIKNGRVVL